MYMFYFYIYFFYFTKQTRTRVESKNIKILHSCVGGKLNLSESLVNKSLQTVKYVKNMLDVTKRYYPLQTMFINFQ